MLLSRFSRRINFSNVSKYSINIKEQVYIRQFTCIQYILSASACSMPVNCYNIYIIDTFANFSKRFTVKYDYVTDSMSYTNFYAKNAL